MKYYDDYRRYVSEEIDKRVPVIPTADTGLLSFTPYISNRCSAACRFCSERLTKRGAAAAGLSMCDGYRDKLVRAFLYQRERPMSLSVSGMEPSESPEQLRAVSEAVRIAEQAGCSFPNRVMYSNLSGFTKRRDELLGILGDLRLTRIECSRHHYDETVNQSIARFKPGETIRENAVFSAVVHDLLQRVPITMVCVTQRSGVASQGAVEEYLDFARRNGVERVVFRELSVFLDQNEQNDVTSYITESRVEMMDLLTSLPDRFRLERVTEGYYYYSFIYRYEGMEVLFEMSDYNQMVKRHYGDGRLHKLIFYCNGDLCRDWDMRGRIDLDE